MKKAMEIDQEYFDEAARYQEFDRRSGTWKALSAEKVTVTPEGLVIQNGDRTEVIPFSEVHGLTQRTAMVQRAKNAVILEEKKRNGKLAELIGVQPNVVSMFLGNPRPTARPICIAIMLCAAEALTVEEAEHVLMEIGYPGFFTNTYDEESNRSNYLTKCVFGWANAAREDEETKRLLPDGCEWLGLLEMLLRRLGLPGLLTSCAKMNVPTWDDCGGDLKKVIEDLEAKVKQICAADLRDSRRAVLKAHGLKSGGALYDQVANKACCAPKTAEEILLGKSRGCYDNLVRCYAAMGCSMVEMNLILQQADCALLYPRSTDQAMQDYIKLFEPKT